MGERILERIHHFTAGEIQVRVWAKSENIRDKGEELEQQGSIISAMRAVNLQELEANEARARIAESISVLPFCNAIEVVIGPDGGILVYPDWP